MNRFKNTRTIAGPALLMGWLLLGNALQGLVEAGMQVKDPGKLCRLSTQMFIPQWSLKKGVGQQTLGLTAA